MEQLQADFKSLLDTGDLSDIIFNVKGKQFHLHKTVLAARSPVFKKMFSCKTEKEESTNDQVISDIDQDVFEELLQYIYCGTTSGVKKYNFQLFAAADKYQIYSLKTACSQLLNSTLTIETVVDILLLADSEVELKLKCIQFICEHADEVQKTSSWVENIKEKRADLLTELFAALSEKYAKVATADSGASSSPSPKAVPSFGVGKFGITNHFHSGAPSVFNFGSPNKFSLK